MSQRPPLLAHLSQRSSFQIRTEVRHSLLEPIHLAVEVSHFLIEVLSLVWCHLSAVSVLTNRVRSNNIHVLDWVSGLSREARSSVPNVIGLRGPHPIVVYRDLRLSISIESRNLRRYACGLWMSQVNVSHLINYKKYLC